MPKIKITQTQSVIRRPFNQKRTIEALGLGRMNRAVTVEDTPALRGMVDKVKHLVAIEEVNE